MDIRLFRNFGQMDIRLFYFEVANESYDFFHKNYQNLLNKHAPIKALNKKQQDLEHKPWVTQGILTSTKIKNSLYKKFKKSKLNSDYQKFKIYRNTINSLLRKSKKHFYKEYFTTHANNIKKNMDWHQWYSAQEQ